MVYVTHDQMEAMAMADTIAIMNNGVIEQLGAPQDVYDRPASVFVADFIGSPAMNFIPFAGAYDAGSAEVLIGGARVAGAAARRADRRRRRCSAACVPSTCASTSARGLRAEVVGSEYLGHSQIVTVTTAVGSTLRAKVGPRGAAPSAASTSAWRSTPARSRCSTGQRPRPGAPTRGAPWLSFASSASASASAR